MWAGMVGLLGTSRPSLNICILAFDEQRAEEQIGISSSSLYWNIGPIFLLPRNRYWWADCVELIRPYNAHQSWLTPLGQSLLLHHRWSFTLAIVKFLIEKGSDTMARDNKGFTLIIQTANGAGPHIHLDLLDFLLEMDDIGIMEKIEAMELSFSRRISSVRLILNGC